MPSRPVRPAEASRRAAPALPPAQRRAQRRPRPVERGSGRFTELDGLRGVAALVVVLGHALVVFDPFERPQPGVHPAEASWWLTHTPLAILWAGPQAVFVFFVLSGFVLALPATTGSIRWVSYYPRRLVRLYLPVWGSLAFAVGLAALVPLSTDTGLSGWYERRAAGIAEEGLVEVLTAAALVVGTGWHNSPLWSLQWEVLFSLLLPVYLVAAGLVVGRFALKAALLVGVIGLLWFADITSLAYMAVFALGVLVAIERVALVRAIAPVFARGSAQVGLGVVVVVLLSSDFVTALTGARGRVVDATVVMLQVSGALGAVGLALFAPAVRAALQRRTAQWLALHSFSLYLVHEPVVLAVASAAPGLSPPLMVPTSVVLSLVTCHVFYRLVEKPAHTLSRAVGRRVDRSAAARDTRPKQIDDVVIMGEHVPRQSRRQAAQEPGFRL